MVIAHGRPAYDAAADTSRDRDRRRRGSSHQHRQRSAPWPCEPSPGDRDGARASTPLTGSVLPTRDAFKVKPPYATELDALEDTYAQALSASVDGLVRTLAGLGRGPAVFVGSGGTMALATLACRLHERCARAPATACTSLELLDLPQLDHRGAMLISSSAKHPDARRALGDFRRGRFAPAVLLTHRRAEKLSSLAGPDTEIVCLPALAQPDGFLATASIVQITVLLLRAYLQGPVLAPRLPLAPQEPPLREEVLVLAPPALMCVAIDLEVRLVESGLACVQVSDHRNFAHGRHTGFARRMDRTSVLVLSDPASAALAEGTAEALPAGADVRRWHAEAPWPQALVELLNRSVRLAGTAGAAAGLDVARPAVPAFGRRLYRLALRGRVPAQAAGGVERKMLALGAGEEREIRAVCFAAAADWAVALAEERFAGVVLDYDGTVCWTSRRFELPDAAMRTVLTRLLERGLTLGIASGRGQSLHRDLRRWLAPTLWPNVILGLYNGAVTSRLDDELGDLRAQSPWSEAVAAAIGALPLPGRLVIEARGAQVSVAIGEGRLHHGRLREMVRQRLAEAQVPAQVLASGHSVDVVPASANKTLIAELVAAHSGGQVLAVGDQGQIEGNDYALLAGGPFTLSVDRCSADPTRCWFAGDGQKVGPELLLAYLGAIRKLRNGFVLRGVAPR
jgi:trehalose-6-phosphatase